MPTPNEPIQVDEMPKKYERHIVQRVLESALSRVVEQQASQAVQVQSVDTKPEDDPLIWVL